MNTWSSFFLYFGGCSKPFNITPFLLHSFSFIMWWKNQSHNQTKRQLPNSPAKELRKKFEATYLNKFKVVICLFMLLLSLAIISSCSRGRGRNTSTSYPSLPEVCSQKKFSFIIFVRLFRKINVLKFNGARVSCVFLMAFFLIGKQVFWK